jgi:trigger factor
MEAAQNLVEESLKMLFDEVEDKPLPYAQPSMEDEIKFVPGEEFSFAVKYDIFPKVKLEGYKGLTVQQAQVTIEKEDLEKELKQLQDQNAIVSESEGPVADTDMVTATYWEIAEDGGEVADTKRQDFQFTIGQNANYYQIDDDVLTMKKGDTKAITKSYDDKADPGLAGRTIKLSVTVTRIRKKELPALDDELAQDIDEKYKTLDELKKDIKARLEKSAESRVRQQMVQSLIDQIVEKHPFAVPESMVNAELYNKYEQMVRQFGGREATLVQLLQAQGSNVENLLNEWKPHTEKDIRAQIVIRELVKAEKIEATDADVDAEVSKQAESSRMSVAETREYFEKNGIIDQLKHHVEESKLFDKLLADASVKKGDKVKYVDLMANNR